MAKDELILEQKIIQNAEKYACPENSSLFNIEKERVMTNFIAGAQWANKTILQEVLKWLENGTTDTSDEYANPMVAFITFDYKEQMLQAFKEQFNIE